MSNRVIDVLRPSAQAIRQVAANRGLRNLQVASFAWSAGEAAYLVGLLVLAHIEGGTASVAFVAVIRSLPSVVLAPVIMGVTERLPRDRLLRFVLVIRTGCVAGAAATVFAAEGVELIYLLGAIDAVAAALLRPLRVTLGPALARSPEELVAANVATSTGDSLAGLVGPGLAAGLLVLGGIPATFIAGSAVMLLALIAGLGIRPGGGAATAGARAPSRSEPGPLAALRELTGLGHARVIIGLFVGQRFVRGMLTVLIVAAAFDVVRLGESGVGILTAAVGFGGLAGGALALGLVGRARLAPAFVGGLLAWGLGILVSGVVPVAVVSAACLAAAGVGKVVLDVSGFSLLQRTVPAARRGVAFGVLEGLVTAALALGSVVASILVASLGASGAIVTAGALPIFLVAVTWPILRAADDAAVVPERELRLLRTVPMFRPLQLTTIEELAGALQHVRLRPGVVVVRQGRPGRRFFIVAAGRLETSIDARPIGQLGPGDSFGEIALLRDVPRTATVRTLEPTDLVALPREPFLAAVTGHADAFAAADDVIRSRLARA